MHTHCLHHFHAYSLFALQLPLYNLHFCALCKCCLLSKPPTSHLRSAHTVMLCHSFHLCSLPSPPQTHTMYTYMHVFDQIVSIQVSTCSHPYHCSNQRILKASKSSLFFKWTQTCTVTLEHILHTAECLGSDLTLSCVHASVLHSANCCLQMFTIWTTFPVHTATPITHCGTVHTTLL